MTPPLRAGQGETGGLLRCYGRRDRRAVDGRPALNDIDTWPGGPRPNFFIIGAPKCGTTSLAAWLAEHPAICMSRPKEPKFFSTDLPGGRPSVTDYAASFAHAEPGTVAIGEASPHYLRSAVAVPAILKFEPAARFIVCLRDPVDMIQSSHDQLLYNGEETFPDLEAAWRVDEGRQLPVGGSYRELCALGQQVQALFAVAPRDRIHVVTLDEITARPEETYFGVLDFLGLERAPLASFPKLNASKSNRSPGLKRVLNQLGGLKRKLGLKTSFGLLDGVAKWNRVYRKREPVSPAFEAELREHFRPEVLLLQALLDRDLSAWLTPPAKGAPGQ